MIKHELLDACFSYVNKRISSYKDEIETIKESIENNDKSNDEDDDSGNGKLFNDLEKNAQYLSDATKMLDTLKLINPKTVNDYVVLGSLVKTNSTSFFIAVSVGKVELTNDSFFVISKSSPIGELLMGKTKGDVISFNGTTYTITEVS